MTKWIKLYGARNTNTNYLSKLIELNLQASQLRGVVPQNVMKLQRWLPGEERVRDWYFALTFGKNLGWKHMRLRPAKDLQRASVVRDQDVVVVTITKNPYSWLLSLHRRPYSEQVPQDISFEDFLRRPWQTTGRDNLGGELLESPVQLWNLKNESYLRLSASEPAEIPASSEDKPVEQESPIPIVHLKTESIFADPAEAIDRLSCGLQLDKATEEFVNFERSTKDWSKGTDYYRDYYLNERWREKLSPAAIASINAHLDESLMGRFGYEMLS